MKNVLLIFVLFTSLASMAYSKDGWQFEAIAEQYPAINSIFNIREPWIFTNIGLYKGYAVMPRPMHGFALYKAQEWTFYTPDIIKANLINKEAIDSIDMKQINMHLSCSDNKGNLWLAANNAIYRFNSEGIYCYYSFRNKEGNQVKPFRVFNLMPNQDDLYCQAGYIDLNSPQLPARNNLYKFDNNSNEFIEFAADTVTTLFCSPIKVLIDTKGNQYSQKTLLVEYMGYSFIEFGKNDTLVFADMNMVLNRYYDNNHLFQDSIIRKLEREREIKNGLGVAWNKRFNLSTSDPKNNVYFMKIYSIEYKDGKQFQHDPRIYKYSSQGNASFIDIPLLPGDSTYYAPDDFASDADGNIVVVYFDKGIYYYTPPAPSGVENTEQILPGAWIWNLFPNPASNRAKIEFHLSREASAHAQITINDIRGTVIKDISHEIEYDAVRQEAVIDFSVADIPSGNYYILISAGNSKKLKRFIVNR